MTEALEELGLELPASRKLQCPTGGDTDPSLHVYDTSFYCFHCQKSGDGIGLIALYTGQDVRTLVAQRGGNRHHNYRLSTKGLKRHDVERSVYRRYQELHHYWFDQLQTIYAEAHDWALLRAIDLYSQMFDDLRDQLLGSGFYEATPSPFEADQLIDALRARLESVVDAERLEARRVRALP
ncbi:hypothetical protein LCGC14_2247350 [marine sediment metagenome]|uniref:Zinc finger CHC2-type domain-containing protein n=1 Tax=marine sediment metagenome TaxID=412755 RepID=A0A0F9D3X5_9ZZZZ